MQELHTNKEFPVMVVGGYRYLKWWLWGLIILGAFLPVIVGIAVEIIFNPKDFHSIFRYFLSPFFSMWSLLILLWNDIPFIVFAFIIRSLWNRPEVESYQDFFKHKTGVIGAGAVTIGISLFVNINIWVGIVLHLPGASTSVIAYLFLPFITLIAIPIGYWFGRLVGKLILKKKR